MDYRTVYETLRSASETEQLLYDHKQAATALLSLKYGIFESQDAALSYCLMSLCTLLQKTPSAWGVMEQGLVDRIVSIAATQDESPTILCPALSIIGLVALESHHHRYLAPESCPNLLASIEREANFLPLMVSRLSLNHVQTVYVTLQVINSLLVGLFLPPETRNHMYCSIRESDLFRHAAYLVENKPVSSALRPQLCDLQEIIKACIKRTKQMPIDPENNVYHKLTYVSMEQQLKTVVGTVENGHLVDWKKAGVDEEVTTPIEVINTAGAGWAGVLDFNDFFSEDKVGFKKIFLEQVGFSRPESQFPLLKASLTVTCILYDIFNINDDSTMNPRLLDGTSETLQPPIYIPSNENDNNAKAAAPIPPSLKVAPLAQNSPKSTSSLSTSSSSLLGDLRGPTVAHDQLSNQSSVEKLMSSMDNLRPLFFDWTTLHFAGVSNFMRIWTSSKATTADFDNLTKVVTVLFDKATQHAISASSSSQIDNVVSKLDLISYEELRAWQLKLVESRLNEKWGEEIKHLHRQYIQESQEFVREQRVRLLLKGDWFFIDDPTQTSIVSANTNAAKNSALAQQRSAGSNPHRRYFVALSPSRKTLQYSQFPQKLEETPAPEALTRSVDLSAVSKVTVTPLSLNANSPPKELKRVSLSSRTNYSKITLSGTSGSRDGATLQFYSDTPEKAAAWGDGLLMLKNKSYQSADTKRFIEMFAETKLRIQMLNLSPEDLDSKPENEPEEEFDRSEISTDFYYN
ncbi:hypothetical protein TRVA0_053S00980 [Trichomonascus vanleenenianus]|uniref:Lmo1p n=1 Tax=Trichomonascus vanleenenianus TaxID=2268995 RepID=UPI003ECA4433